MHDIQIYRADDQTSPAMLKSEEHQRLTRVPQGFTEEGKSTSLNDLRNIK